ncbi:MAG TPA: carboxypeptidase regulatory-like domain-containing protein [Bryobacteraceae bacterium]|nr:carboxypeptidase regulatory-like domain-containing protein [Bryobacteraceae bacterium]
MLSFSIRSLHLELVLFKSFCSTCTAVLLVASTCLCFLEPSAFAQAVAIAEVDGHVLDQSGAPVANAQVRMTETDKQQVHNTVSDPQGRYALPNLPVGAYKLEVTARGFKNYSQTGIVLQVAHNVEANVIMQIGSVSESIEVVANAAMVETKDNALSQVIDQKRVVELPLNGRNATQLILLTGAATSTPAGDLTGSKNIQGSAGSITYSVAGGQANGLNFLLDGGDNNDPFSNVNLPLPFPDALQEFSVQTSAMPAQYGLHPGGVVNSVTKSGANAFHGDLFEFLRNGDLNARQAGTNARDTLKRSQFGGVLGGRIVRDRLFFFGGYQGTRQRSNPPSTISFVPTAATLAGDFGTIDGPTCHSSPIALKNPISGAPYANNQIPVSQFDPAAIKLVTKYIPVSADPCGQIRYGIPANSPDSSYVARVDYVVSPKHNMFGRYFLYDYTLPATFDGSNALTTTTAGNDDRSQTATFGDTYTFSPTSLNSFHVTFNRRRDNRGSAPNLFSPVSLGVNMFNLLPNFINLTVTNYFAVGCGTCAPGYFNTNTYQLSDDYTVIHGKHQFGIGVDVRKLQLNIVNNQQSNGQFTFGGAYSGDNLADFLLGRLQTFNDGNPNPNTLRQTVTSLYVQDTYRVTQHFTLNLGVRWEPSVPPYDKYGRGNQFSLAAFNAGQYSTVYPNAPAGLLFAGDAANANGKYFSQWHLLATSPRIGMVWDPKGDGKQTIRSAFALMHDTTELFFPERLTTNPPYASSVTLTNVSFSNPYAGYPGGNPFPGASIFPAGGTYVSIPADVRPTYMMQWNLSFQRQLGKDWLLTVNYIGSKTSHILGSYDINPGVYIPNSTASLNTRRVLYLQNPTLGQAYSGIEVADDGGNSNYNGLLTSVQHRFANNFTLLSNLTWSHCISDVDFTGELAGTIYQNPNSRAAERSSCGFDRRLNFNTSMVVATPRVGNAFVRQLTGGWQLSPIFTAYSGQPLTLTDGGKDISQTGQLQDRPDVVLPNAVIPAQQTVKAWINPLAFQMQPAGAFGNLGRFAVVGPGTWNLDFALSRIFKIRERFNLEARGEAFNIFNHANWNNATTLQPIVSITSSTFGQITSFSPPRIIQLAMKLSF